jgi:4-hydroxymandelate oxidase
MEPINLFEFERIAAETLPKLAWDYFRSGACDEVTMRRNEEAFQEIGLRQRVLVDVSRRDTSVRCLGRALAAPTLIAPTAFHKLAHPEGELATARAAGDVGSVMVLSMLSNTAVEEVVAATSADVWFQLYVYRDRGETKALCERAYAAGCKALVVTVDAPVLGRRERDVRNRFSLPDGLTIENAYGAGHQRLPHEAADSGLSSYFADLLDPALSWKDLEWLRGHTPLPLLVKGILRADDAQRAIAHGAAGVIVSNHGGRQLDTAIASVEALPEIADALGGGATLLLDGGVRRGTDILKALALGAHAVLVGRPILWGLAAAGQRGVVEVLSLLKRELDVAMALCGCTSVAEISRDLIRM